MAGLLLEHRMRPLLVILVLLVTGCAITVKDYDAEKMESEQIKGIKKAQKFDPFNAPKTPDHVKVIDDDNVYIEVKKGIPLTGHDGIKLEVWHAFANNENDESKCVTVKWQLQDFEFETNLPDEFLIMGHEKLTIGKMRQTIWAFDSAFIALPPSGYASGINVRDADINPKTGAESCEPDESNIDTI